MVYIYILGSKEVAIPPIYKDQSTIGVTALADSGHCNHYKMVLDASPRAAVDLRWLWLINQCLHCIIGLQPVVFVLQRKFVHKNILRKSFNISRLQVDSKWIFVWKVFMDNSPSVSDISWASHLNVKNVCRDLSEWENTAGLSKMRMVISLWFASIYINIIIPVQSSSGKTTRNCKL